MSQVEIKNFENLFVSSGGKNRGNQMSDCFWIILICNYKKPTKKKCHLKKKPPNSI